jgi:GntR family transcriptional repressor for pyruvate dehydrogenase complex
MRKQVTTIAMEAILAKIASGEYEEGAALKCQPDLAVELGVSRASLREALSTLETLGYLRIEPGRGTFVAAKNPADTGQAVWKSNSSYKDSEAFQARLYLETAIAAETARDISLAGVEILQSLNEDIRTAWRMPNLVRVNELDVAFHEEIVGHCGNRLLKDLYEAASRAVQETQAFSIPATRLQRVEQYVAEHEKIIDAMKMRDAQLAQKAMQDHIINTANAVGVEVRPIIF